MKSLFVVYTLLAAGSHGLACRVDWLENSCRNVLEEAGRRAMCKSITENPVLAVLKNLSQSVAVDMAQNEFTLHRNVHVWFAEKDEGTDRLSTLNARVYRDLFLMPEDDPWLGLGAERSFTGLQGRGLRNVSLTQTKKD